MFCTNALTALLMMKTKINKCLVKIPHTKDTGNWLYKLPAKDSNNGKFLSEGADVKQLYFLLAVFFVFVWLSFLACVNPANTGSGTASIFGGKAFAHDTGTFPSLSLLRKHICAFSGREVGDFFSPFRLSNATDSYLGLSKGLSSGLRQLGGMVVVAAGLGVILVSRNFSKRSTTSRSGLNTSLVRTAFPILLLLGQGRFVGSESRNVTSDNICTLADEPVKYGKCFEPPIPKLNTCPLESTQESLYVFSYVSPFLPVTIFRQKAQFPSSVTTSQGFSSIGQNYGISVVPLFVFIGFFNPTYFVFLAFAPKSLSPLTLVYDLFSTTKELVCSGIVYLITQWMLHFVNAMYVSVKGTLRFLGMIHTFLAFIWKKLYMYVKRPSVPPDIQITSFVVNCKPVAEEHPWNKQTSSMVVSPIIRPNPSDNPPRIALPQNNKGALPGAEKGNWSDVPDGIIMIEINQPSCEQLHGNTAVLVEAGPVSEFQLCDDKEYSYYFPLYGKEGEPFEYLVTPVEQES